MQFEALRIIIAKQDDIFVAQCLEHDISVQAQDIETLQRRFEDALILEAEMGNIDALPPAPDVFHALWDHGSALASALENAEVRLAA